jgi:hypothetical protein
MTARANLLILLGGLAICFYYANPMSINVATKAEFIRELTRPRTPFETALPWIQRCGFALVLVGLALKLVGRTRRDREA